MARAQLERLLQAWHGPAWASQRTPPTLVPSSWVARTPSGGRPAGAPLHSPVGEGNACGRGARCATQAALVSEAVLAARVARTVAEDALEGRNRCSQCLAHSLRPQLRVRRRRKHRLRRTRSTSPRRTARW